MSYHMVSISFKTKVKGVCCIIHHNLKKQTNSWFTFDPAALAIVVQTLLYCNEEEV